jgi:hypothetical protein
MPCLSGHYQTIAPTIAGDRAMNIVRRDHDTHAAGQAKKPAAVASIRAT